MKNGWPLKKLSDLYRIGSSKRVLKSEWKSEGVPFYRGREVTRLAADGFVDNELFISEKHFATLSKEFGVPKAGDIVITAIGTIGNSYVVRENDRFYFKDASVLWMKRTAEVSSEFINLWLKSPCFFDQLDRGNGATVDTLTIQKLQSVQLVLPPLTEQNRIVAILDEAFENIANTKINAEKNLINTRDFFESYLQAVYFSRQDEKWAASCLADVCEIKPSKSEARSRFSGKNLVSFVPMEDLGINQKSLVATQTRAFEDVVGNYTYFANGDVLLAKITPCFENGKLGIVDNLVNGIGFGSSEYIVFRPSPKLNKEWLYYFLSRESFRTQGAKHMTGSVGHKRVTREFIENHKIPIPPIPEQIKHITTLDILKLEIQCLETNYRRKIALLDELKKALLHKAFAGEL